MREPQALIRDLDLALMPTHPDQAAGLGFVGVGQSSWAVLVLACRQRSFVRPS